MSMICYLLRLPAELIERIKTDTELCDGVTGNATKALAAAEFESLIALLPVSERLDARIRRAEAIAESRKSLGPEFAYIFEDAKRAEQRASHFAIPEAMCLHKAWDVLDHVLTRDGLNREVSLFAGEPIGGDRGYGSASLKDARQTAAFADFLASPTVAAFLASADLTQSDKIYAITGEDSADDVREVFEFYLPSLRDYAAAARKDGDSLLLWLS